MNYSIHFSCPFTQLVVIQYSLINIFLLIDENGLKLSHVNVPCDI